MIVIGEGLQETSNLFDFFCNTSEDGVQLFWFLRCILLFYSFYLLATSVEDYKLGWAFGMAILAAILELVGIITTVMSQKSDQNSEWSPVRK